MIYIIPIFKKVGRKMKKNYYPCKAILKTLAINTLVRFDSRSRKRYQIDAIGKDFVYLHEFVKNGQIIFAPAECEVIVYQGF